jgi:hypothetical protein
LASRYPKDQQKNGKPSAAKWLGNSTGHAWKEVSGAARFRLLFEQVHSGHRY